MQSICLAIVLLPLTASVLLGIFPKLFSKTMSHRIAVGAVGLACTLSLYVNYQLFNGLMTPLNTTLFVWAKTGGMNLQVGFLIDELTAIMMAVVTFVSCMVHIYTIGYMADDAGYKRFFSYIALFTFAMLMLVMANNFLQLFFGWEAVGLVSYLLIGFWFHKESAIFANLKAFLVNRVGDFGFILGIGAIYSYFGTLNYAEVFAKLSTNTEILANFPGLSVSVATVICILLFIGAMGKSAQVPLHVWLPDSMEGPTPISALIHAATMVTAGVFLVARMSPMFELSEVARSFVLVIGATTCLFMGLIGIVQSDIKRIIAYSTLSQLGYMMCALGASAYAVGVFHLVTHAFFKALLFLGAGSCIIAMHHDQNIFHMGNLKKYMPITYLTMLLGSLAIIGFPFFSGFYSKDLIIEAVHLSNIPGAHFAYFATLSTVFITAFYSFRLLFLVFHTKERMTDAQKSHLKESPWVVTLPLILLAIPSVVIGFLLLNKVFGSMFGNAITVLPENNNLTEIIASIDNHGAFGFALHGFTTNAFYLAMAGVFTAFVFYIVAPKIPAFLKARLSIFYNILNNKYGFDDFNQLVLAGGVKQIGAFFSSICDKILIDGLIVNGTAKSVAKAAKVIRHIQSGYIYHYAFIMFVAVLALFIWLLRL